MRLARDIDRALLVIRDLRLQGPHDGPDHFTIPKRPSDRLDLADLIFDLADEHAARALLDLPPRAHRVSLPPRTH